MSSNADPDVIREKAKQIDALKRVINEFEDVSFHEGGFYKNYKLQDKIADNNNTTDMATSVYLVTKVNDSGCIFCAKVFKETGYYGSFYLRGMLDIIDELKIGQKLHGDTHFLGIKDVYYKRRGESINDKDEIIFLFKNRAFANDMSKIKEQNIDGERKMKEKEASEIFEQVLIGLNKMHMMKIVHSDLKPENILVSKGKNACLQKNAYLIDFGSAFYEKADSGEFGEWKSCTKHFRSPEFVSVARGKSIENDVGYNDWEGQIDCNHIDRAHDYWSLGLTISEMVLGEKATFDVSECTIEQLQRNGLTSDFFKTEEMRMASDDFIDVICLLLEYNRKKRKELVEKKIPKWTKTAVTDDGHEGSGNWFSSSFRQNYKEMTRRGKHPVYAIFRLLEKESSGLGRPAIRSSKIFWVDNFEELHKKLKWYEFKKSQKFYLHEALHPKEGYGLEFDESKKIEENKVVSSIKCLVIFYKN